MKIIEGNLITAMLHGEYDVALQGCNCQCIQGAGLAAQMVKYFATDSSIHFTMESSASGWCKNINKLGCIDYAEYYVNGDRAIFVSPKTKGRRDEPLVTIVNCYTQTYPGIPNKKYGIPLDYDALTLCLRKINSKFAGKSVALPYLIGCGLAGGNEKQVLQIIEEELIDVDVTIIELPQRK